MGDTKEQKKTHPSFAGPEDTILITSDDTHFHISSAQLARASGWFRTMFSLPQSDSQDHDADRESPVQITVSEDSLTLEILLDLSCGTGHSLGLSRLSTLAALELCLRAAEKYEMTAALQVLPLLLYKAELQKDALYLYALAGRYGPEEVAASALKRVVTMRLDSDHLARLDNSQLRRLFTERQKRVEKFCLLFAKADAAAPFALENVDNCALGTTTRHYSASTHPRTWVLLALALQTAFIQHPSVADLDSDSTVKLRVDSLVDAKCVSCGLQQYAWSDIRRRLVEAMDGGEQPVA